MIYADIMIEKVQKICDYQLNQRHLRSDLKFRYVQLVNSEISESRSLRNGRANPSTYRAVV